MPVVISPDLVLAATDPPSENLNHARIGIDKVVTRRANLIASTASEPGFPALSVTNELTYEAWKPLSFPVIQHSLTFDARRSVPVNYLGIAAHNLGTNGVTVALLSSPDNIVFTKEIEFVPGSDRAIMVLIGLKERRYWRVTLDNVIFGTFLSVVYIGRALEMQRAIYGGHSPILLSRITAVRPTVSETGQWLGRSIIRKGFRTDFAWKHLTPDWYRSNFDPFVQLARKIPFFIAWRPARFPDEVAYAWTSDNIKPTNMGLKDLMEVSFNAEALDVALEPDGTFVSLTLPPGDNPDPPLPE